MINFEKIYAQINSKNTKLGDLRKLAKEIKKNHALAMQLWGTFELHPQLLSILIMDTKLLSTATIDKITTELLQQNEENQIQLIDWFMANQLTKSSKTIALVHSWQNSSNPLQRRVFWYHQARLRWTGKTDQTNTNELLEAIEKNMINEVPMVQWAMNFTAAQIGIWQEEHRNRCIAIGEKTGLYKDEMTSKNCTPNYLPQFISIEVDKLKK